MLKRTFLSAAGLLVLAGCPTTQIIEQKVILPPSGSPAAPASPSPNPEQKALIQVIHDNANALNGGDESRFKATFHQDSDFSKQDLGVFYQRLRNQFMTRYNIVETSIRSQSADIATVIVRRRTTDYTGTIEQDVLYTVRKHEASWKIFAMDIQAARPLS